MNRRIFLQRSGIGTLVLASGAFPLSAFHDENITKLTILHTNDVHSRIDPFPMDGSRNEGMGGAAKRAALIKDIRIKEKNVLLLDAGDIFQGTPYFNFFGGELEFKLMSAMKYDAATIGNHDFDGGIDGLAKQLAHANFPMVISNYDFSDTIMHDKHKDHLIFEKEDYKIGVFGVGIELDSLVPKALYKNTVYMDPISKAQEMADRLRHDEKCDLVICLSHLGYKYRREPGKVSDVVLSEATDNIDIIIGGHTHTFMSRPDVRKNKSGKEVVVNQVGWAGIMLGRLDVYFERSKKDNCISCRNTFVR